MYNIFSIILLISPVSSIFLRQLQTSQYPFNGDITSYGADLNGGFCGFKENDWNYTNKLTVAINKEQIYNSLSCGRCVNINYNNQITTAIVDNICPECKFGDLDLSNELWQKVVGDDNYSRYPFTWEFVNCDSFLNNNLQIKDLAYNNDYWMALTPINFKCGIKNIKIKFSHTDWIELQRDNNIMNGMYFLYNGFISKPFDIQISNIYDENIDIHNIYDRNPYLNTNKQFPCKMCP